MRQRIKVEWNGESLATLSQWFFDNGATVVEGDLLCELTQDKAVVELRAPVGGALEIVVSTPDSEVSPGTLLGLISEA